MRNSILSFILPLLIACGSSNNAAVTLAAPSEVQAQALSATEAVLSWTDNTDGEDGYYVFSAGVQPVASLPAGSTSYQFSGLEAEATYVFGVQAYGKNGNLSLRVNAEPLVMPAAEPDPGPGPGPDDPPGPGPDDPPGPDNPPGPEPDDAIRFNWTEVSVSGLPETVKIYKTTDKLEERAFNAWYAIADPKEVAVRVLYPGGGNKATIDKQAEDAGNCLALINGGIFGSAPIGFAIMDGEQTPWRYVSDDNFYVDKQYWGAVPGSAYDQLHYVSRGLFGVDASGVPGVYWSYTPEYGTVYVYDQPIPTVAGEAKKPEGSTTYPCVPADWTPYNAITCGPVLLKGGECPINAEKNSSGHWLTNYELWADDIFGVNTLADRTAVGFTSDGKVILFICDGRIDASKGANTLEVSRIMKGLGCVGALNLDGGGSTGLWVKGAGHINDLTGGNRAVMTTIGFFSK